MGFLPIFKGVHGFVCSPGSPTCCFDRFDGRTAPVPMMQWLSVVYIVQKWVYMYTYICFLYIYTHEKICIQLYISILLYICLESICIYVYLCIYVFLFIYIYNIDIFPRLSSVQNWFHEENSNKKHLLVLRFTPFPAGIPSRTCAWNVIFTCGFSYS